MAIVENKEPIKQVWDNGSYKLLLSLSPIFVIAVFSLMGWLLHTSYSQAQEISVINTKSDFYLPQIGENTKSINTLTTNLNSFRNDQIGWNARASENWSRQIEWNEETNKKLLELNDLVSDIQNLLQVIDSKLPDKDTSSSDTAPVN